MLNKQQIKQQSNNGTNEKQNPRITIQKKPTFSLTHQIVTTALLVELGYYYDLPCFIGDGPLYGR